MCLACEKAEGAGTWGSSFKASAPAGFSHVEPSSCVRSWCMPCTLAGTGVVCTGPVSSQGLGMARRHKQRWWTLACQCSRGSSDVRPSSSTASLLRHCEADIVQMLPLYRLPRRRAGPTPASCKQDVSMHVVPAGGLESHVRRPSSQLSAVRAHKSLLAVGVGLMCCCGRPAWCCWPAVPHTE
jgi:hypothetical protein